ncbi:MAG TPA: hypothetical protein PLQ46_01675 [bacterium]|nr:hypothetical protein [bacterium]HQE63267.1 hypothetical protein [bacterium]
MSKTKKIIIIIVIMILLLLLFHSCFRVEVTRKPSTKSLVYQVLDRLGLLSEKVNNLSADVDTIKVDVRELKGRKTPRVVYKTIKIVQPAQSSEPSGGLQEPQQLQQPQEMQQEPPKPETVAGTIVPGPVPGPQDLVFCIDLEPEKVNDSSKKFLFWELCNNLGYNISNVVPNATGKPANMRLSPGGSADGIVFDGETLRISASSLNAWYSQIFGVPMPPDFRPGIRSNKSGWQTKLMSRSGDYFVYRF